MENQNNQNEINDQINSQQQINTNEEKIEIEEVKNTEKNQKSENTPQNLDNQNKNIKEEEKNNEELDSLLEKKKKELENEKIAQRQAQLKIIEKKYDDLLKEFTSNWEKDKLNFEQYYMNKFHSELLYIAKLPCIILYQDTIGCIFIFFCKLFNFIKDILKEIPKNTMKSLSYLYNYEIFNIHPNLNINNNIELDYYDIIGDKFFYDLFKKLLPEGEIENPQLLRTYNGMTKYFLNYLCNIGYVRNYIVDFLSRNDFDFFDYIYYSQFPFQILFYCDDDYVIKNDYNLLLIQNFTKKMNYFFEKAQEFINKDKNQFQDKAKMYTESFFCKLFGGLTRIFEMLEQKRIMYLADDFCLCLFKHIEILLKQQKLELRIFGFNQFVYYINFYNSHSKDSKSFFNDSEKVYEYSKKQFIKFLQKINIFDLVFGENIHEALIQRSYFLFSFLYKNKIFTAEQISLLWKISQSKYQSISNSIIGLFGKLLPEFSNDDCNTILKTVTNMNLNEVNEITLKLLENFFVGQKRHENLLNILFKYSNELSYYEGLSNTIINKSRDILVKLLFNKIYSNDLHQCIKNCLFCIDNNYLIDTNLTIFIQIINRLSNENSDNNSRIYNSLNNSIENYIYNLDVKYSLYTIE